jgi:hypothetical protein
LKYREGVLQVSKGLLLRATAFLCCFIAEHDNSRALPTHGQAILELSGEARQMPDFFIALI